MTIDKDSPKAKAAADRLPEDLVLARFTGDEFVAILPGMTDRAALRAPGERLVSTFQEPFRIGTQDVIAHPRVGIALTPADTGSAADLLTLSLIHISEPTRPY